MRKATLAFLSAAALAALSVSASAADLGARPAPVYKAPPPLAASWAGFYLGISGGYGWDRTSQSDSTGGTTGGFSGDGGLVGGTAGYNWQNGNVVFGLEGDMSWARIEASTTSNCPAGCSNRLDWLATARARAGLLISPTTLAYATGGASFGGIKSSGAGFSGDDTKVGWTVGAGVEQKFAGGPWSAKLEYLYTDFGQTDAFNPGAGAGGPIVNDYLRSHIVRAGINYQFGAGGSGWR